MMARRRKDRRAMVQVVSEQLSDRAARSWGREEGGRLWRSQSQCVCVGFGIGCEFCV